MTSGIYKKADNKPDGGKRSTKYYAEEMRELWIFGGHESDISESGYRKEDIHK